MAVLWHLSGMPIMKANGDPDNEATVRFFNENTVTPQTVYSESSLSLSLDQPVPTNARGQFPAIFLSPGTYKYTIIYSDATTTTVDGISVPQASDFVPPDAGETDITLLFRTGMRTGFYGTTAPSGWVRAAGRTIGSATSGATERANADCEDLFLHLWSADENLVVSTGRGATAAGDWAANKTIALPDYRERVAAGLATMGNSDAGLIADALLDADDSSTLGAKGGADDVTLTSAEMPAHNHTATFTGIAHSHTLALTNDAGNETFFAQDGVNTTGKSATTDTTVAGGTIAVDNTGSGDAHTNLQPTIFELIIIKL